MNLSAPAANYGIGALLVRQKHDEIGLTHRGVKREKRVSKEVRSF
jgi:hypothetical protein